MWSAEDVRKANREAQGKIAQDPASPLNAAGKLLASATPATHSPPAAQAAVARAAELKAAELKPLVVQLEIKKDVQASVVVVTSGIHSAYALRLNATNLAEDLARRYNNGVTNVFLTTLLAELYADGYAIASQGNSTWTLTKAVSAGAAFVPKHVAQSTSKGNPTKAASEAQATASPQPSVEYEYRAGAVRRADSGGELVSRSASLKVLDVTSPRNEPTPRDVAGTLVTIFKKETTTVLGIALEGVSGPPKILDSTRFIKDFKGGLLLEINGEPVSGHVEGTEKLRAAVGEITLLVTLPQSEKTSRNTRKSSAAARKGGTTPVTTAGAKDTPPSKPNAAVQAQSSPHTPTADSEIGAAVPLRI